MNTDLKILEYQDEDEKVVDRQGLLHEVARVEFETSLTTSKAHHTDTENTGSKKIHTGPDNSNTVACSFAQHIISPDLEQSTDEKHLNWKEKKTALYFYRHYLLHSIRYTVK